MPWCDSSEQTLCGGFPYFLAFTMLLLSLALRQWVEPSATIHTDTDRYRNRSKHQVDSRLRCKESSRALTGDRVYLCPGLSIPSAVSTDDSSHRENTKVVQLLDMHRRYVRSCHPSLNKLLNNVLYCDMKLQSYATLISTNTATLNYKIKAGHS